MEFSRPKVARDIKECIETLEKEPQDFTDVIGILRRCAFEVEGIENIWRDDMTSFQKATIAIDRGFDIEKQHQNGVLIKYLGYYLMGTHRSTNRHTKRASPKAKGITMYDKIIVSKYNDRTREFTFPKIERRIHQMKDESVEGYPLVTTTSRRNQSTQRSKINLQITTTTTKRRIQ